MEYQTYILSNGIKLIHKPVKSPVAHAGIIINTGSRDEHEEEHGIAHFIEHMIFKGTKKRKAFHILSRLEDVGGELNAYTSKEETCIYASFMKEDYQRAFELISDIVFNSSFPERELEKEKEVIIEEINSYLDQPGEQIFDDFEELIYKNAPIGRSILGTPEKLRKLSKNALNRFIQQHYNTDQIIVCSVGKLSFPRLVKYFEKYFSNVPATHRTWQRKKAGFYHPEINIIDKDTYQSHCIIGNRAYDLNDKRRTDLHLLNNILGGQGLNSRLNLSLREKNGYAYNIESNYSPYFDTGVLSIYFGTDRKNLEKSINLTHKEFDKLKTQKLGQIQLARAKRQLMGQLMRSSEINENLMLAIGKSYLVYGNVETPEEINRKIEAITASGLMEIANEILDTNQLSMLAYK
ncbi:MAG: insulinase family protein [Bacteroidetes bacterium]|nr:insulinase family protein [Bacteroidota bacterium]